MRTGVPTWVVGAGGLLGGAVCREAAAAGLPTFTSLVPWGDPAGAAVALRRGASELLSRADGGAWNLAWCAGAGVVGTSQEQLALETRSLATTLDALDDGTGGDATPGGVFLASSAGGLYAGSRCPPYTELTEPRPVSAYGQTKLAAEGLVRQFGEATGAGVLLGRISNLYGPGQRLDKAQGLISQLCRAQLCRRPLPVYVSLDTVRDYLFVNDAAQMTVAGLRLLRGRLGPPGAVVKILAAQQGTTIAAVLGEFRRVFKRPPLLVLTSSATARLQAPDLRFRSVVWPELDRFASTPLPVGIAATAADVAARLRATAVHPAPALTG